MLSLIFGWFNKANSPGDLNEPVAPPFPPEWIRELEGPVNWSHFYDFTLMRSWSNEIALARQAESLESWYLQGPNLLLKGEEVETLSEMVQMSARQAGFNHVRVPAANVADLIDAPRKVFESMAPVVVQLDAGDWCWAEDEMNWISARPNGWRETWRAIDPKQPVVFVLCVQDQDRVSEEWRNFGAFDRCIHVQTPNAAFLGQRFLSWLGASPIDASLANSQTKVGLMLQSGFPTFDSQRLAALQMRRIAASRGKQLEFDDLANLAIRGSEEFSDVAVKLYSESTRNKTAYHEAGHACIAVIESKGRNVPDYCSIVPAGDFAGIVMQSLSYVDSLEEFTFENLLLRTRIALAGRAAEEIYFGPSGISSGANSDLSNATRLSFHMFAHSGFHPLMEKGQGTSANLAVNGLGDVNELEYNRIQSEVREFLSIQYEHVVAILKGNSDFVDAVAQRLLWDPVIDQEEMIQISQQFGLATFSGKGIQASIK
jgi:hypothetical protein